MKIDIPYEVGNEIVVDGVKQTIKGLHIFVNQHGEVANIRAYVGGGFVLLHRTTQKKVSVNHGCKQQAKGRKV